MKVGPFAPGRGLGRSNVRVAASRPARRLFAKAPGQWQSVPPPPGNRSQPRRSSCQRLPHASAWHGRHHPRGDVCRGAFLIAASWGGNTRGPSPPGMGTRLLGDPPGLVLGPHQEEKPSKRFTAQGSWWDVLGDTGGTFSGTSATGGWLHRRTGEKSQN